MAYTIAVIEPLKLIVVKMNGVVSCGERSQALDRVLDQIKHTAFSRLLVDFQDAQPATDTFEDSNRHARRLAGEVLLGTCRVAYLVTQAPALHSEADLLANARGFSPEHFKTLSSALYWLLSKPGHS